MIDTHLRGMKVELTAIGGGKIMEGKVDIHEDKNVTIRNLYSEKINKQAISPWINGYVKVIINDPLIGLVEFDGKVKSLGHHYVNIEDMHYNVIRQRREDVRVTTTIETKILKDSKGKIFNEIIEGIICDLSVGGMLFESKDDINKQTMFRIDLDLETSELNIPLVKIERKYIPKSDTEKDKFFHYACSFHSINESQITDLRNYIYKVQLRQRKNIEKKEGISQKL
ncbi:MAG: PilZ domain-containing protein [Oscillospiraceae bacterium]|nr:PilZ domain-containing protein [Oscillospiraceae bacterium]